MVYSRSLTAIHPREHYTPERCATDSKRSCVVFTDILKGKEERTCTIPAGKAILLPALSESVGMIKQIHPKDQKGLIDCATWRVMSME